MESHTHTSGINRFLSSKNNILISTRSLYVILELHVLYVAYVFEFKLSIDCFTWRLRYKVVKKFCLDEAQIHVCVHVHLCHAFTYCVTGTSQVLLPLSSRILLIVFVFVCFTYIASYNVYSKQFWDNFNYLFHISLVFSYNFLPLYFNFVPSLFLTWLTLMKEYAHLKLGISEWFSLNTSKEPMHCDWRIINKIASIRLKKYAHKFVLGHDLFLSAHNFTWALLLESIATWNR